MLNITGKLKASRLRPTHQRPVVVERTAPSIQVLRTILPEWLALSIKQILIFNEHWLVHAAPPVCRFVPGVHLRIHTGVSLLEELGRWCLWSHIRVQIRWSGAVVVCHGGQVKLSGGVLLGVHHRIHLHWVTLGVGDVRWFLGHVATVTAFGGVVQSLGSPRLHLRFRFRKIHLLASCKTWRVILAAVSCLRCALIGSCHWYAW